MKSENIKEENPVILSIIR